MSDLNSLLSEVRACRICADHLPLQPGPILQCSTSARILIAGQAPGRKAQESGIPFDDVSGDRLRAWMGIDRKLFYDSSRVAILPMGFCYPGSGKSGDLPPRPECEIAWRSALLGHMRQLKLTLVVGQYAQKYHLGSSQGSLTERVKSWRDNQPDMIPLPHPSPRNNRWLKQNPWFQSELLPDLRSRIGKILKDSSNDR